MLLLDPPEAPSDGHSEPALGLLGLVAILLGFLTSRVLPGWRGCAEVAPAILRLQLGMLALSATAWQAVEAPCPRDSDLDRMQRAAEAVLSALRDLLARIARMARRPRPFPVAGGHGDSSPRSPVFALVPAVGRAARARDGPAALRCAC